MTAAAPLPPAACLLHVGPYKTGSSSIQAVLAARREELAHHGVAYPGASARARRAGWAVIGTTPRGRRPASIDDWRSLVQEVEDAAGERVCVSTEDFARVDEDVAKRVVEDLGAERVHVLTVVRRLDRLLPSQWQQRAQSLKTDSYEEYLHAVLDPDGPEDHPSRRAFWASHDAGKVLATWAAAAGQDRVVALVADEDDRAALPRTFEQLLALPAGLLQETPRGNPSLSYNAVELLRRLNVLAAERGWPDEVYTRVVREAARAMKDADRSPLDVSVPRLPAWAADRVRELSEQRVAALLAAGVTVLGDPDSLRTVDAEGAADPVATIAIGTVVEAVRGAVVADEATLAKVRRKSGPTKGEQRRRGARTVAELSGRELLALAGGRASRRVRALTRVGGRR